MFHVKQSGREKGTSIRFKDGYFFMTKSSFLNQAIALHDETPVADLHIDFLLTNYLFRYNIMKKHKNPIPYSPMVNHTDIPRLKKAGVAVVGAGLVCSPLKIMKQFRFGQIRSQLNYLHRLCAKYPNDIRQLNTNRGMEKAIKDKAVACLPGVEGAHALAGDLLKLDTFFELGVRYFTLAHFSGNEACNCPKGIYNTNAPGLTGFGRKLVDRIREQGMILDVAHTEREAFFQALERFEKPAFVSHTGLRGVYEHWRNIDDQQLEAVAKFGGVVGIMFANNFLGPSHFGSSKRVVDHIMHAVRVVGPEHVAIGSDMDGWIMMPRELSDVTDLPDITAKLLEHGLPEEAVKKILGENVIRVIRANLS